MIKIVVSAALDQQKNYMLCALADRLKDLSAKPIVLSEIDKEGYAEAVKANVIPSLEEQIVISAITDDTTQEDLQRDLLAKMQQGIAHFSFKKVDGSIREAFGTTHGAFIPDNRVKFLADMMDLVHEGKRISDALVAAAAEGKSLDEQAKAVLVGYGSLAQDLIDRSETKAKASKSSDKVQVYYDLEKQQFRNYQIGSLIKIH